MISNNITLTGSFSVSPMHIQTQGSPVLSIPLTSSSTATISLDTAAKRLGVLGGKAMRDKAVVRGFEGGKPYEIRLW